MECSNTSVAVYFNIGLVCRALSAQYGLHLLLWSKALWLAIAVKDIPVHGNKFPDEVQRCPHISPFKKAGAEVK